MKSALITHSLKRGFTLIELMVVIAILAALASIGYPTIMKQLNSGDRSTAQSNMKEVSKMLMAFQGSNNGQFPCDATADELKEQYPDMDLGNVGGTDSTSNHSNAYFRQLFYDSNNRGQSAEKVFYAKINVAGKTTKEGDGEFLQGKALEPGECGISYVLQNDPEDDQIKISPAQKGEPPLLMCSVYPSKDVYTGMSIMVDIDSFLGNFFYCARDGSVQAIEGDAKIVEDENLSGAGKVKNSEGLFPKFNSGKTKADKYIILTPEFGK